MPNKNQIIKYFEILYFGGGGGGRRATGNSESIVKGLIEPLDFTVLIKY